MLEKSVEYIKGTSEDDLAYRRIVQEFINGIIEGLLDPVVETRLSSREALYLFYVLGKIVDSDKLESQQRSDGVKLAKTLITDQLCLELAMSGAFEGILEELDKSPNALHCMQLTDLVPGFQLPKYSAAVAELKDTFKASKKRLLI